MFLSDLLDLPPRARHALSALATRRRTLVVGQVLDPDEERLPYEGHARFSALEGDAVVEADPDAVRGDYLAALAALRAGWTRDLAGRAGGLVHATSDRAAVDVVRELLDLASGQHHGPRPPGGRRR